MLGDLNIAEPKALIGFAGPARHRADHPAEAAGGLPAQRVPAGHGMIDMIVDRRELKETLARALRFMCAAPSWRPGAAGRRVRRRAVNGPSALRDPRAWLTTPRTLRHQARARRASGRCSRPWATRSGSSARVHIAGTNGKGSVTAMVDAASRAAGHRTGRYTSPHLVAPRRALRGRRAAGDRGTLDGALGDVRAAVDAAARSRLARGAPHVLRDHDRRRVRGLRATQAWTWRVIEVGLGGRFDATNVVDPVVAAITSIALDHEQYLGTTLEAIAFEKAGIVKPGVPVVVGDLPEEARGGRSACLPRARRAAARHRGRVRRRTCAPAWPDDLRPDDAPRRVPATRRSPCAATTRRRTPWWQCDCSNCWTSAACRCPKLRSRPASRVPAGPARLDLVTGGSRTRGAAWTARTTRPVRRRSRHTSGRSGRTGCRWCLARCETSRRRTCCGPSPRSRSR